MNLLFFRTSETISGAEIYTIRLLRSLRDKYHDINLAVITNNHDLRKRFDELNIKTFYGGYYSKEVGTKREVLDLLINLPHYFRSILPLIRKATNKYLVDIVLLQTTTEKILLTPVFFLRRSSIIWIEHGPFFSIPKSQLVYWLYRLVSIFPKRIIAVSTDTKKNLIEVGQINPGKVVYIPPIIDSNKPKLSTGETSKKHGKDCTIGFVGKVCQEKGIEDFIQVADLLLKKKSNFKFTIVGDGPMLSWAEKEVEKKRISKSVAFAGFKKNVGPYLSSFDIFFFPTRHFEGLPVSVMEAMDMEKPVIARNRGGVSSLVKDGRSGILYDDLTNGQIAEKIIKLCANKKRMVRMGKFGKSILKKNFDPDIWLKLLTDIFYEYKRT